jgi:hypothetical protein
MAAMDDASKPHAILDILDVRERVTLDLSAYPHIRDMIIAASDAATLQTFRRVSHTCRIQVARILPRRLIFKDVTQPSPQPGAAPTETSLVLEPGIATPLLTFNYRGKWNLVLADPLPDPNAGPRQLQNFVRCTFLATRTVDMYTPSRILALHSGRQADRYTFAAHFPLDYLRIWAWPGMGSRPLTMVYHNVDELVLFFRAPPGVPASENTGPRVPDFFKADTFEPHTVTVNIFPAPRSFPTFGQWNALFGTENVHTFHIVFHRPEAWSDELVASTRLALEHLARGFLNARPRRVALVGGEHVDPRVFPLKQGGGSFTDDILASESFQALAGRMGVVFWSWDTFREKQDDPGYCSLVTDPELNRP